MISSRSNKGSRLGKPGKSHVTIKDVAEYCGMSVMTVSRSLRHDGPVSPETRATVLAAAEALGYRNRSAKGRPRLQLPQERQTVAVILSTEFLPDSLFYTELILAIESELGRNRHECVIRTCHPFTGGFHPFLDAVKNANVFGTLVVGHFPREQAETIQCSLPRPVFVDYIHPGEMPYGSVNFDNFGAARQAVTHLIGHGRRRVALLKGRETFFSREIEMGYREALFAHDLEVDPELIWTGDFTGGGGLKAVSEALQRGLKFDGLFTTDEMAFGAFRALTTHGIRIGEDVAVFGCDGLQFDQFLTPSLSTVELNRRDLGKTAVRHLFDEDTGESCPKQIRLSGKLILRESCGCKG